MLKLLTLSLAILSILPCCLLAEDATNTPRSVKRVGILFQQTASSITFAEAPFWDRFHELGWVKDLNLHSKVRYADCAMERMPGLAADLPPK